MPNRNKIKGNRSELELAKILSDTFNAPFIRVPTSGAMTGGQNASRVMDEAQRRGLTGDIIPPAHMNMVIECKNVKQFPFHQLLQPHSINHFDKWLSQIHRPYWNNEGSMPWSMIAFKVNHLGWYVIADPDGMRDVSKRLAFQYRYHGYIVSELNDFLTIHHDEILHATRQR